MSDIRFEIASETDTIPVASSPGEGGSYRLRLGTGGFGMAPAVGRFSQSAANSSKLVGVRFERRSIPLVIEVHASGRDDMAAKLRRLALALRVDPNKPEPRIVARYDSGEIYELSFTYRAGGEDSYQEWGETIAEWPLMLEAAPFWVSREPVQFSVFAEGDVAELQDDLAAMKLGGLATIESFQITNPGDYEASIDWRITGPSLDASIAVNGLGFVIEADLTADDVRIIDGARARVTDLAGADRYTELGPAPRFPVAPMGESTVVVSVLGSDPGEWIVSDAVLYTNRVTDPRAKNVATSSQWSSWSNGTAAGGQSATGFPLRSGGYSGLTWAGAADPVGAHKLTFPVTPGEFVSPSMHVVSNKSQTVQPGLWIFDALGNVLTALWGPTVEMPAGAVTRVSLPGGALDAVAEGAVSATFVVSIYAPLSVPWASGDYFRASLGAVTDTDVVLAYFDGTDYACDWTGTTDASSSEQFAIERVDMTSVGGSFRPLREVVF